MLRWPTYLMDPPSDTTSGDVNVEHGKPAPDIFLFAAAQMGATPDRCAVVEDSVSGVTAALSAEMSAFAFAGSVTSREALSIGDAVVFDDMAELPALLRAH